MPTSNSNKSYIYIITFGVSELDMSHSEQMVVYCPAEHFIITPLNSSKLCLEAFGFLVCVAFCFLVLPLHTQIFIVL